MKQTELVDKTNKAISELVCEKPKIKKAYNYYNCTRDKELFKYLEDNYGIGQPTSVEFIPLIRKHVDALVGEYLDIPIIHKVSCKDKETINNIFREKQIKISTSVASFLEGNLKNNLLRILNNLNLLDLNIKELLDRLIENINENFISEYEIAGLNVVEYIILSRNIDLITKLKLLFIDLLVTGFTFFRVTPSSSKHNIDLECLSPLDTFAELNYNTPYINECLRVVVRKFLTRNEILNKYGNDMSSEDIGRIRELWRDHLTTLDSYYVRNYENNGIPATDGIRAGEEVTLGPYDRLWEKYDSELIPVYEVEWIELDKNFVEQLYQTIRIGTEIYILKGKNENAIRTKDYPEKVKLTVNGVWFNNRSLEPYSIVTNCMVLLDKYDLLHFYRDNLIASSGTVGDFINLPTLPAILGKDLSERLLKWKAYKKEGFALVDTSQDGLLNTGQAPLNTLYNGYDDTIKVQAVQAILLAIDSVELTASSITGVFRERLNGIQQRDAVTNVLTGINNSFTITKQWHFQMDLVTREILLDCLNCAKIVYKKGLTGTLILGEHLQLIFTALPKYFTVTDFDIHITTSSEIIKQMEQIKNLVPELIKAGIVTPDILVDILTSKSLTDMKLKVKQAIKKLREENNQLQLLTLLVEELQNNLLQASQLLQQAQQKVEQLNEAKLQLESQKIQLQNEVEMFKARTDRTFKETQAENDTKRTQIELMLLYDGNPYNDEVKNI